MRLNTLLKSTAPRPTQRLCLVLAVTITASIATGCTGAAGTSAPRLTSTIGISDTEANRAVSRVAIPGGYDGTNYARVPLTR